MKIHQMANVKYICVCLFTYIILSINKLLGLFGYFHVTIVIDFGAIIICCITYEFDVIIDISLPYSVKHFLLIFFFGHCFFLIFVYYGNTNTVIYLKFCFQKSLQYRGIE